LAADFHVQRGPMNSFTRRASSFPVLSFPVLSSASKIVADHVFSMDRLGAQFLANDNYREAA